MDTNGERYRPIIISGKYYLTDVVPTSPKVYFTIEPVTSTNEEIKVDPDNDEDVVRKQFDQFIENGTLPKSIKNVTKNCEDNEEIVDAVNTELQKNILTIINDTSLNNLDTFLNSYYKIEIKDNKVTLFKISDLPELSGKNLEFKLENNTKYIFIDDAKYKINIENGEMKFKGEANESNDDNYGNLSLVRERIDIACENDDQILEIFDRMIKRGGYNMSNQYDKDNLLIKVKEIRKLVESSNNPVDKDLLDYLDDIINGQCALL